MEKLVLLGLHTQPTSAGVEIDALVDVVAWAEKVAEDPLFDDEREYNRLAILRCSSLAISMLAEPTSLERKLSLAGGFDRSNRFDRSDKYQ